MNISIVWFKKDLRIVDHKPLHEASKSGLVLPLYIYEPEIIEADDYDPRHHQFINDSLLSLKENLKDLRVGPPKRSSKLGFKISPVPLAKI